MVEEEEEEEVDEHISFVAQADEELSDEDLPLQRKPQVRIGKMKYSVK